MPTTAYLTKSPEGTYYHIPEDFSYQSSEVEMQEFLYGLVRYLKPALVFESGANHGYGAMALGMACEANNYGRVVSYETDPELADFARNTTFHLPRVTIVEGSSLESSEIREADLIFSDSDRDSRIKEYDLAKPGCVYVVHDTCLYNHLPSFVEAEGGQLFQRGRGFGIIVKKEKQ